MGEPEYIGGFREGPIRFEICVPMDNDALKQHILAAQALGLPEISEPAPERPGVLRIVANGPSARKAPLDDGVDTAAVNGSIRLFTERGLAPTYWAACDPLEIVSSFLADAPTETEYLVASKCHPSVFQSLLGRDRRVRVWNVGEDGLFDMFDGRGVVLSRCSITLTALCGLFPALGYRSFEIWGWDGCIMDGARHAVAQDTHDPRIEVLVGDQSFLTTPALAVEAEDMVDALRDFPLPLSICGGGMFGAMLAAEWSDKIRKLLRPDA